MKTKKILSLVMAIAMTLSLATTALASGTTPALDSAPSVASGDKLQHKFQYTGNTTVPVINLVVTGGVTSALAFNPYKLAVGVDANGVPVASGGTDTINDQLITKPITITNLTNVPLKLEGALKVTAFRPNDATIADGDSSAPTLTNKAISATETAKKLYVYADFYAYDDAYANVPDTTKTAAAAQRLVAATSGVAVPHASTSRVVMQATDGEHPNYVYVKVSGEATPAPTIPWAAYDKVQIDFVFNFQSQPNFDKYAVVEKSDSSAVTVKPTYSKDSVLVAKATGGTDLTAVTAANKKAIAGSVCYIAPASSTGKITGVKFYDKTGTTVISTVKATSTNTKDPTAPWSFTMPADNVVMEVTTS